MSLPVVGGSVGGGSAGGPSSTGSTSSTLERSTCSGAPLGGGQVFGQSEPGERQPHAVPGLEDPRGRLELDLDLGRHARLERDRRVVPVAVREVEDAAARERRGAVGEDVAEARRQVGDRHGRGDGEPHARVPHHVEVGLERLPVVGERERVVEALIAR